MKKTFLILIAALAAVTGCKKNGGETGSEDFAIDASAHTITLTVDTPVEALWITEDGADGNEGKVTEAVLSEDGTTLNCSGDWFVSTVNMKAPKEVTLTVDENATGKNRQLTISVYHMGKSASTLIVQKTE